MTTRAEREFHREMLDGAERLKREVGYNPTRFNQMVAEHGGPEAARQLLSGRSARLKGINEDRRAAVLKFLDPPNRSDLATCTTLEFNEHFGAAPRPSLTEIQYPGNWSVSRFSPHIPNRHAFRATCRFKWAFNVKPDLVIHGENRQLLCIEAKWDSPEGSYPSGSSELGIFAQRGLKPLLQTEVQQYLVETLLGFDGSFRYLAKREAKIPQSVRLVTWPEALAPLDLTGFASFVQQWRQLRLQP